MNETDVVIPYTCPPRGWWSYDEVAGICQVSPRTLMRWVRRGQVPSPQYVGQSARFLPQWMDWVMTRGVQPASTHEVKASVRSAVGYRVQESKRTKPPIKKRAAKKAKTHKQPVRGKKRGAK